MQFDPDAFLASPAPQAPQGFDPDAFLAAPAKDKKAQAPTWGGAISAIPGAAANEIKGAATGIGNFVSSLPDDPLGYKIGRGLAALPGAIGHELGGMTQFVRNLSAPEFRGDAPTFPGGEPENHPYLAATTQGNTGPLRTAIATAPLGVAADLASMATGPGRGVVGVGSELAGVVGQAARSTAGGARNAIARRLVTEALGPEEANLVTQYEGMGGHLRPGQYSPSNFVRQGDAVIADTPWPRAAGFHPDSATAVTPSQQANEFNRFLSRSFGEDTPRITGDVITRAQGRIGRVYEDVLPRTTLRNDDGIASAIGHVESNLAEAAHGMNPADVNQVNGTINRVKALLAGDDGMSGTLYQTYRARGGLLDELAGSKSNVVAASGTNLRNALDDAFARQATGADAAALTQAKEQWRALQTIKPLADKAPTGNINPGTVLSRVVSEYGSPTNAGALGTVAQVGNAFLKALPNSGTSERGIWRSLINKPFSEGLPALGNAAVGLPVSLTVSRQLNRVINNPDARALLLARALENQGATAVAAQPSGAALARALQP